MLSRRTFLQSFAAMLAGGAATAADGDAVVLITAEPDPDFTLATVELRRLFLGFVVYHDGHALRPVRNLSDERLDQVFYQHIVAMSREGYERRLLALSLQQGRLPPLIVRSTEELVQTLVSIPHAISFCWRRDIAGIDALHEVRVLWEP
jgi:hypothetical protein